MTWAAVILLSTFFVAFSNGANDNFKGVATLFGSSTVDYRLALVWATTTTFAGSLCAYFISQGLIETFSGKGLVPGALIDDPAFLTAVILGAGLTVFFASRIGIPVSTTHSLTGALVGAGLIAVGSHLGFSDLGKNFFVPLLISPILALLLSSIVYAVCHWGRDRLGIKRETCLCIGGRATSGGVPAAQNGTVIATTLWSAAHIVVADQDACERAARGAYTGRLIGFEIQKVIDGLHFLSAGAVSFARGLNDTPKIVALAAVSGAVALDRVVLVVASAMAVGGLVSARKVAQTMSLRITDLNHGQGLAANAVTASLVIFASHLGLPVSTTHVACGALFGIGVVNGRARWKTIGGITMAWVLTLPVAATVSAVLFLIFHDY